MIAMISFWFLMRKRSDLKMRNLPPDVAVELERGLGLERKRNGLAALAGKWSPEEFMAFEQAVQELGEVVDDEVWR